MAKHLKNQQEGVPVIKSGTVWARSVNGNNKSSHIETGKNLWIQAGTNK